MSTWRAEATKLLSKFGKVREHGMRDFGREPNPECVAVLVRAEAEYGIEGLPLDALAEVRKQLPVGTVAYLGTTNWLGEEKNKQMVELVIGPGTSQFDILRHAQSDAVNFDLDTEALINRLSEWHEQHGIELIHAETDTIEFVLLRDPDDPGAFADEIYEFCPDIIDQGSGSVEELAQMLVAGERVFLWWD